MKKDKENEKFRLSEMEEETYKDVKSFMNNEIVKGVLGFTFISALGVTYYWTFVFFYNLVKQILEWIF